LGKSEVATPAITERCTNLRLLIFELSKFSLLTFASRADSNNNVSNSTEASDQP
jgi:hypothetical protein